MPMPLANASFKVAHRTYPELMLRYGRTVSALHDAFAAVLPNTKVSFDVPPQVPPMVANIPIAAVLNGLEDLVNDYRRVGDCLAEVIFGSLPPVDGQKVSAETRLTDDGVVVVFDVLTLLSVNDCICGHCQLDSVPEHYAAALRPGEDAELDWVLRHAYATAVHEWGHVIGFYLGAAQAGGWTRRHFVSSPATFVPPLGQHLTHVNRRFLPSRYAESQPQEAFAEVFAAHWLGMRSDRFDPERPFVRDWISWGRQSQLTLAPPRRSLVAA